MADTQRTAYELIVVGGGPAGLAAALAAHDAGLRRILILERDKELGGILNQCIHNGFGLHYFKEELTGPEYAGRFVSMLEGTGIEVWTDTMVLAVTPQRQVQALSPTGYHLLQAGAVVLAMGCRERPRGAIGIPGNRPAGVFTAGAAQRYINMEGFMVGRRVVVLGSGDIGLIMARRMTLEGAKVLACVELMPYSGGLTRNIVQCLQDYDIPLYLSHTVTQVMGKSRVEQVVVSQVDQNRRPIPGSEKIFDCDTLLLSVGLIPENELTKAAGAQMDPHTKGPAVYSDMQTSIPGIFACGNVVHVHDLVDFVTTESQRAGKAAAAFVLEGAPPPKAALAVHPGQGLGYAMPQQLTASALEEGAALFFRVGRPMGRSRIVVTDEGGAEIAAFTRQRMAPGEMEQIRLPAAMLRPAQGSLTISAVEQEAIL